MSPPLPRPVFDTRQGGDSFKVLPERAISNPPQSAAARMRGATSQAVPVSGRG